MKKNLSLFFLFATILTKAQSPVFEWAISQGGTSDDSGTSLTTDTLGNTFVTGFFRGTTDFDPGAGTFNLTANGNYDIFIEKLDAAGNLVWARSMGSQEVDNGLSVALDGTGNVYVTGFFQDTVDFDPGAGLVNLTAAPGTESMFVLKLSPAGNYIWAKSVASSRGQSIAVDPSGNTCVTGYYTDTTDFDPGAGMVPAASSGSHDVFILKLDATGNFLWSNAFGSFFSDYGASLAFNQSGSVYITGVFHSTIDFDSGSSIFNLTAAGSGDLFILKLDPNGNFIWAKKAGGTSDEYASSLVLDPACNIYLSGGFYGTADFDPGAATFNLTSAGDGDIYISKLDSAGNFIWAKGMGGTYNDFAASVALDVSGNVYTTGYFLGTTDLDPGPAVYSPATSGFSLDIFISKLDTAGNFVWAQNMGASGGDNGNDISVDKYSNVYTTGNYTGTVDFDPSSGVFNLTSFPANNDLYIHKMSQAITGIPESINFRDITAFPNPTTGTFNISISLPGKYATMEIYNTSGNLIQRQEITGTHATIDLATEANGLYLIKIISDNNTIQSAKIVKQ
ncbi:MAG: hypothetical protein JWO09_234 [Bacteroidetes bacterium]|nr:hypothetical protein [Bacteroidota bacterium]